VETEVELDSQKYHIRFSSTFILACSHDRYLQPCGGPPNPGMPLIGGGIVPRGGGWESIGGAPIGPLPKPSGGPRIGAG
jgi:hypothetical protein